MIRLYASPLSGNAHKVRMALSFLNLSHEEITVPAPERKTPDFLAINPLGQVPVLVDVDVVIRDSQAILVYLATLHRPGEWDGRDAAERARIMQWLSFAANEIANGPAMLRLGRLFGADIHEPTAQAFADKALKLLEAHLATHDWLEGGRLTIADIAASPYIGLAADGGIELGSRPNVTRWLDRIAALPAFPAMQGWSAD
ncbi:glutathione S-transferase family protein [Sphingomonas sp. LaA6.9]|uniref:glutathione S-transferase family protein n=1 Tax=Sphingomonas sp. LaA6.9 TaxID=2919914 RepID=UPI001F4FEC92|nr:glutathione S-transferase N-terminal domain-containing protein [Sphingomonas sp. LaA6.9]MCJ8156929.1 glutathione S-transferase N-terminal domain-containing protein [Sphingomonas sp. LaA6.9]